MDHDTAYYKGSTAESQHKVFDSGVHCFEERLRGGHQGVKSEGFTGLVHLNQRILGMENGVLGFVNPQQCFEHLKIMNYAGSRK